MREHALRRRTTWLILIVVLLAGIWLCICLPEGKAEGLYQTVPTMPPPTHTASPTSQISPTSPSQATPSATSPAVPSATVPQATGEVPTQAGPGATASTTVTETMGATNPTPEETQAQSSATPTIMSGPEGARTVPELTGEMSETLEVTAGATEAMENAGNSGLLVGVIIGGVVLVMVIVGVVVVILGGRKRK